VRRMEGAPRASGTFYTIEVLGFEGSAASCASTSEPGGMPSRGAGADARRHRTPLPPSARRPSAAERACRNVAVVAARCAGRPVGELALIPLDASELADRAQLAATGIPMIPIESSGTVTAQPSPAVSPPDSSRSLSVPDRDAPEEYAAWCSEIQRCCREASATAAAALAARAVLDAEANGATELAGQLRAC